ncbi:MAG TPA: caspase family protein [Longimicrobiales bacterium]|nr:caspase family protein [Longimicrobiales bacterium]
MRRSLSTAVAALTLALTGCGEAPKIPLSKAGDAASPAAKEGSSTAARAARLSTAFAGNDGSEGVAYISPGEQAQGSLSGADDQLEDGSYYDAWIFDLAAAGEVGITMRSSDVDAYLALYAGTPGRLATLVASDDDGAGISDAFIGTRLAEGTYTIVANSHGGGETGSYTLSLEAPGSGGGNILTAGEVAAGDLSASDPSLDDGSHFDVWTFHGNAGDRISVTMTSTDVDAFLLLYRGPWETGEFLAENDDGAGMPDARIAMTLSATGTYSVVAGTYGEGETGRYALRLESAASPVMSFDNTGASNGRYALLVGIDDYPGTGSDLRGPVRDAQIMRNVLVGRFGFSDENVVLLTDADATRENIANAILAHLGQAGPDGVAVFFYSGHGTRIGADIGLTGSLDPEPRGDGDEALYIHGHTGTSSVLLDEELEYLLASLEAGRTLAVMDACFTGEVTRGGGDAPRSKRVDVTDPEVAASLRLPTNFIAVEPRVVGEISDLSPGSGDARVFSDPQRHVLWDASAGDQVSWTSGLDGGASVFSWYLGERLASAPLTATLQEVHRQVAADVERYIDGNGHMTMQIPQLRGSSASMTLEEFFRQR